MKSLPRQIVWALVPCLFGLFPYFELSGTDEGYRSATATTHLSQEQNEKTDLLERSRRKPTPLAITLIKSDLLQAIEDIYNKYKTSPIFWLITSLISLLGTYILGMLALLLLGWRHGSIVLSRSRLRAAAAKPLQLTPKLGQWLLFVGYKQRLLQDRVVIQAAKNYFGLPADDSQGTDVLPDTEGESLHRRIAEALNPQQPLLVIGKGGAGKTTLLARLAYLALSDQLPPKLKGYIPLLIPARFYSETLTKAIADTLYERDGVAADEAVIKTQLQSGNFLVLFDGVSEVIAEKQTSLDEILRTARHADYIGCRFLIATRPLSPLPADVRTITLQPLTSPVIANLLKHYRLGTARENQLRLQLRSFGDKPIEPLLLTMMLGQRTDAHVGVTRTRVYEEYFRELLKVTANKDLWIGWRTSLEVLASCFFLNTGRRGAGMTHESLLDYLAGERENETKIESIANRLKRLYRLPVDDELDILNKLETAGLLQRERRWRFVHDTFEEYFAASYLVSYFEDMYQWPIIEPWRESEEREQEFLDVLDFVAEMVDEPTKQRMLETELPALWRGHLARTREPTQLDGSDILDTLPDERAAALNGLVTGATSEYLMEMVQNVAGRIETVMKREMVTPADGPVHMPSKYVVYLSNEDNLRLQGGQRQAFKQTLFYVLSLRARELAYPRLPADAYYTVDLRNDSALNKGDFNIYPSLESSAVAKTEKSEAKQEAAESLEVRSIAFEIQVLALQNTTFFPETVVPLAVGRARSVAAVESALSTKEKLIACVTVRPSKSTDSDANSSDLYEVGTLAMIKRMERLGDTMHLIVQGTERVQLIEWKQDEPYLRAIVEILPELPTLDAEDVEATKRNVQAMVEEALKLLPGVPPEVRAAILGAIEPVRLAYFLGSILNLGVEQEQKLLEANTSDELLRLAHTYLLRELKIIQLRAKITSEAQAEIDREQVNLVLRQQMKTIQKMLAADTGAGQDEAEGLNTRHILLQQLKAIQKELGEEEPFLETPPALPS